MMNEESEAAFNSSFITPRSSLRIYSNVMLNPIPNSAAFIKLLLTLALVATLAGSACRSKSADDEESSGIIVVNAPAAGVVKRILIPEGVKAAEGAGIIEIALPSPAPAPAPQGETP